MELTRQVVLFRLKESSVKRSCRFTEHFVFHPIENRYKQDFFLCSSDIHSVKLNRRIALSQTQVKYYESLTIAEYRTV